ncbi:pilus assembly protein TadG-related protein [Demequina aestuarii]|uniref:pilus assembly protein TadG-related protein n=1 Tax=Demequina aestuarii TaxID=327095 RepID=UPI000A001714|nr:pilus assembly protein TadG-related protein [Demequina aestuarii]
MTLTPGDRRTSDSGSASILTLALVMVVVMVGAVIVAGAAASAVRVAAQHAVDEAALAGAHAARGERALGRDPAARACAAATSAAGDNGARTRRCAVEGAVVTVEVSLRRGRIEARATAVAGPAHAESG